ncbi:MULTISPECIES: hypothetical protein [Kitasatospora]|nr:MULTISPECIES: hypothetical protein [Kitasatospora]
MAISLPGHDGGPLEGTFSADTDGGRTGHVAITGMGAAGTWFPDTPGDPLDSSSCCEPDLRIQRQAGLNEDGTPGRNLAAAAPRRVDGVPTGTVTPTDPRGLLVRYDIAAEGEPRVLSTESGAGNTTARFNGFDQPVRAAAPAAPRRG